MKRKIFKFAFIALIAIGGTLTSCTKEGPQGPQGEQGKEGIQGKQGVQGIPGKAGSVIISGDTAPTDDKGKVGDMYLDTKNNKLYGPKSGKAPVWGTPLDIKGATGEKGDRGSVIHRGNGEPKYSKLYAVGTPESEMHFEGDYYINEENGDLYVLKEKVKTIVKPTIPDLKPTIPDLKPIHPKNPLDELFNSNLEWKKVISLRGPKGDKGDDGNANVVASSWFYKGSSAWTVIGPKTEAYTFVNIPTPIWNAIGSNDIQTFANKGGVLLTYMKRWNNNYVQLPYSIGDLSVFPIYYDGSSKGFSIRVVNLANKKDLDLVVDSDSYFRYVLIPASKLFAARGVDLTKLSYEEVKELYGLED